MIDQHDRLPKAESPAQMPPWSGFRIASRNYSPEYNAAFKTGLLIQFGLAVLTALILDFGHTHRAFWVAFLGQWAMVWILLVRRPTHPTRFDLAVVRYGIIPLLFLVAIAGPVFLRLFGVRV